MKIKISPSLLAADFSEMGKAVKKLEECGADMIHCDVMDGSFVEPITFGGQMVANLRPLTTLPLDVHLMIEHPKTQIKFFASAGADIICVHFEACKKISDTYLEETLDLIKSYGVKCGVAINPDTPIESVLPVFSKVDMIVVMSVFPGYGGQKFIEDVLGKITQARELSIKLNKPEMLIEVDGGIDISNCKKIVAAGANVLVAGSAIFRSENFAETLRKLRS